MMRSLLCVPMSALLAAAPVSAAPDLQQQAPAGSANAKAKNQNEVVCETEEVTGSRLGAKRVCATRSEWQQRQQSDRQDISKGQTQVGIANNGG